MPADEHRQPRCPPTTTAPELHRLVVRLRRRRARASPAYNVYVSDDGGPFTLWQSDTTATSATFTGQVGHTYAFYSVATDNVGLVQPTPTPAKRRPRWSTPPRPRRHRHPRRPRCHSGVIASRNDQGRQGKEGEERDGIGAAVQRSTQRRRRRNANAYELAPVIKVKARARASTDCRRQPSSASP